MAILQEVVFQTAVEAAVLQIFLEVVETVQQDRDVMANQLLVEAVEDITLILIQVLVEMVEVVLPDQEDLQLDTLLHSHLLAHLQL